MRPELKFGLTAGLAWWFWLGVERVLGFQTTHLRAGEYGAWMIEVIQFVMICFLLRAAHRQMPMGRLEPLQAALQSLTTSAILAALAYIGSVALFIFLDPDWLTRMLTWKVSQLRDAGVTEEAIRTYIVATRQAYSPLGLAESLFIITPLVGAGLGTIVSILLNLRWEKANLVRP
jgi:hypothetical protein